MSALDLNHYGRVTAAGIYANVLLTIFVAGLQFFICIYGLTVFVDTPSSSRKGRRPYIIVSFIILITWCITAALDAYSVFRSLSESTSGEEFYRLTVSFEGEWFRVLSLFSLFLGLFVGDGLLLYRAYVVWKDRWWALIFPCVCYLTSLGLALYIASPQKENWRDNDRIIAGSFTFVAVSVNVMVTLLISFRLLRARQLMAKVLPCHDFLLYKKVAIVLIESALPVAFFGLCYAITLVLVGPMGKSTESASIWQVLNMTFSVLYFSFASLSPQMIIFRVTTGRSWTNDTTKKTIEGVDLQSGQRHSVRFATVQSLTTMDDCSRSTPMDMKPQRTLIAR